MEGDYQEEIIRMVKAMRVRRNLKSLYKLTRMWYEKEMGREDEVPGKHPKNAGKD